MLQYPPMAKGSRSRAGDQYPLFDFGMTYPNGFTYKPDFITPDEESALIASIENLELTNAPYKEYVANRRIKNFGWSYDPTTNDLVPGEPLPNFLRPLAARIAAYLGIPKSHIIEALVTEYQPGVGVGWHRDNEKADKVIGISLAGWCDFQLQKIGNNRAGRAVEESLTVTVEPRSIYVMQGESRWDYLHRVVPTKALRYSVTFRTVPAANENLRAV